MSNKYAGTQGVDECAEKIALNSSRAGDCMLFLGCCHKKGYGTIRCKGKMRKTHHIAWLAAGKKIPAGKHLLHRCDHPACWNVKHLFLGTNDDNIKDKIQKDRSGKKLNIAKVKRIKRMLARGDLQADIADKFHIHSTIVSRINTGVRWTHVRIS